MRSAFTLKMKFIIEVFCRCFYCVIRTFWISMITKNVFIWYASITLNGFLHVLTVFWSCIYHWRSNCWQCGENPSIICYKAIRCGNWVSSYVLLFHTSYIIQLLCFGISLFLISTALVVIFCRNGRKFNSMKDFLSSPKNSSPVRERVGISLSAMKSLVLREKEENELGDDEKVCSLIQALLDAGSSLEMWWSFLQV